jgi:hypothetical protein
VLALWQADFTDRRKKRTPSEEEIQAVVWRHYQRELELDRRERLARPKADEIAKAKADYLDHVRTGRAAPDDLGRAADVLLLTGADDAASASRAGHVRALKKQLATGETEPIHWAVDEAIAKEGWLIEVGFNEYRDLAQRFQRAELEALRRSDERDDGNWGGKPADEAVKPVDAEALAAAQKATAPTPTPKPGERIKELYDVFAREKAGSASPDTWARNRKVMELFVESIGGRENDHVSQVSRKTSGTSNRSSPSCRSRPPRKLSFAASGLTT